MKNSLKRVDVEGDPNEVDSFVACVTAIMRVWERPVAYDYVAGLAGVAFSPVMDKGEDCTAWWMEGGDDIRLEFMGQVLGFTVEALTHEEDFSDEVNQHYEATRVLPLVLAQYLKRLQEALNAGKMVIVRTWPSWSVLTGWHEDVRHLPFATLPGFESLCARVWGPHKSRLAYILTPTEPVLSRDQAWEPALKFGAQLATGDYADEGSSVVYGGALYDASAARLDEEFFCISCQTEDVGCAHRTLRRMQHTQRTAVAFLQAAKAVWGNAAQQAAFERAIAHYAAMPPVIQPYDDYEVFKSQWPAAEFKCALAEDFGKLKSLHDAAAAELQRVVAG